MEAGIYLSAKKNNEAKKLYEEIIIDKSEYIYSIMALNIIIEKKLISDKK